jgi:DNA-binding PucR family transcriptional regulator
LDARGASGKAIELTIRTLLDNDRNVEATAAELHLHRNSIRYRIGRFHHLTGLDPRKTEDLVTTWWLLKRRQASRATENST